MSDRGHLGMVTRSNVLSVYRRRVEDALAEAPTIRLRVPRPGRRSADRRSSGSAA